MGTLVLAGLLLLGAAWLLAYLPYRLREAPVRGRGWLVALRTAALFLLALLLWNPSLPGEAEPVADDAPWVVLDATLGMEARDGEGETPWERAVERARALGETGAVVAVYDGELRTLEDPAELDTVAPRVPGSRLAAALERAVESGAREVRFLSDFRASDGDRVREVMGLLPAHLHLDDVGADVRNAGIGDLGLPRRVEVGEGFHVELRLHGEAVAEDDSVTVEIRHEERLLASRVVPAVRDPGTILHRIPLPPFEEEGVHRITARVMLEGDGFAHDDFRVGYVRVEEARGIVLVSFQPDWEPRQLLPVLEWATDLEGEGFLRMADGRYLPLRMGDDGAEEYDEEEVTRRLEQAELAVVHGLAEGLSPGMEGAVRGTRTLLAFVTGAGAGPLLGLELEDPRGGEWPAVPEPPSSALAGDLAGLALNGLPPLSRVLPVEPPPDAETALEVRSGGQGGEALPGLLLRADRERRQAVVPASGFWRWAARGGEAREAYRRLWSAASGYLLRDEGVPGLITGPEERVVPRGREIAWRVAVGDERPVRLTVERAPEDEGAPAPDPTPEGAQPADPTPEGAAPGETVLDTVVTASEAGRFVTGPLPPGPYLYRLVTGEEGDEEEELGAGRFDVDPYAGDLAHRRDPLPAEAEAGELLPEGGPPAEPAAEADGEPVRTHPFPYLAILALLCAEWVLRRRRGLR